MDGTGRNPSGIPPAPGVGYKPQHHDALLAGGHEAAWVEIHAENYMGDGGPAISRLAAIREALPVSCHGVGLSIGGERNLDRKHLARLRALVDWLRPSLFSEHLAWSTHEGGFLNDLLPLPYNATTLSRVADHVDEVQNALGRKMLLENPSNYVSFAETTMSECEFLEEIVSRTGCGLLLDINNVFVSAANQRFEAMSYIESFPLHRVEEIHLGGHERDEDETGSTLLIDSHSRPVVDPVWELYAHVVDRMGATPTLIEWDNEVPEWAALAAEAARAARILGLPNAPEHAQATAA